VGSLVLIEIRTDSTISSPAIQKEID